MLNSLPPHKTAATLPDSAVMRVVRQFLEALLFEGLDAVVVNNAEGGQTFYFAAGRRHFSCLGRQRGFGRIALNISSLAELDAGKKQPVAMLEMLHRLIDCVNGDTDAKSRLFDEMLQTAYWLQWNQQNLPKTPSRRDFDYTNLETHLHEGHPYHPCFKARSGFTQSDHRFYSSECGNAFQLRWLAIKKQYARWNFMDGRNRPFDAEIFYQQLGDPKIPERCREMNLDTGTYVFVPVHPWQWQNVLQKKLNSSSVIDLGTFGDFYVASQSLRTLLNISRPSAANIKLPLSIVCTSSRRHLLSHSVCVAPLISRWLAEYVADDDFFDDYPLLILREFAGVLVDKNLYDSDGDARTSELSVLWRDSVEAHLKSGEQAAPMTALLACENDHRPFIHKWVEHYGLENWLQQLLRVVVLPVWHLLARHGIAVEAHAQNAILIHRDGWPLRLALRDFHESVEYVPEFVSTPQNIPDFVSADAAFAKAAPNEFYWMDSVEALRELCMDTLFVFHLSDLANICERFYQLDEQHFWQRIAHLLEGYAASGWCPKGRLQQLNYSAASVRTESLVTKKLWNIPVNEYHHLVPNPLAKKAAFPERSVAVDRFNKNERNALC